MSLKIALAAALFTLSLAAQTSSLPKFDVVSAKVSTGDSLETRPRLSPGRIRWTTQGNYLLSYAFSMEIWQISGQQEFGAAIFEIDAAADPGTTDAQMRLMMQSLLMDRFGMKAHRIMKDSTDGYAMMIDKSGPKLEKAADEDSAVAGRVWTHLPERNRFETVGDHAGIADLCREFQRLTHTLVRDETGLAGRYNFKFQYDVNMDGDPKDVAASAADAVRQLGLRLEKRKGPVDFLVVDQISKTPTNN